MTNAASNKAVVERYYDELWNRRQYALVDQMIAPEITFRGSLGIEVHGRDGFRSYVQHVGDIFPDFHNRIDELLTEGDRVVVRLTCSGTHSAELFGVPATGRIVQYQGVAMFSLAAGVITSGWVLGDTIALSRQLGACTSLQIRPLVTTREATQCASIMCATEPWVTLQRSYNEALALLMDRTREVYVAYDGRQLTGFLILHLNGSLGGYIQSICVTPDSQGRGIGTRLLQFAEERVFAATKNVFLCVSSFNERARKLYERRGYTVVGGLEHFIIRDAHEVLMRKTTGPLKNTAVLLKEIR